MQATKGLVVQFDTIKHFLLHCTNFVGGDWASAQMKACDPLHLFRRNAEVRAGSIDSCSSDDVGLPGRSPAHTTTWPLADSPGVPPRISGEGGD